MIDTTKLFNHTLLTTSHNVLIGNYIFWDQENELDLNAYYQRAYVWETKEQQDFLFSLFNNLPLGTISIVNKDSPYGEPNYEVVDGKQRITTLLMFIKNEIPYVVDGVEVYFKDLDDVTSRQVRNKTLPYQELYHNVKESDKLKYFYRVNFTGVAQSDEHRAKIEDLLGELK